MDITGNAVKEIFSQANENQAKTIALRVDLVYGNPVLHLTGYRIGGGLWVRFTERDERIPFTHEMITLAMDAAGWCMPARPVRQPGISFIWNLQPTEVTAETHHYSTHARDVQYAERHAQNRFESMQPTYIGAS